MSNAAKKNLQSFLKKNGVSISGGEAEISQDTVAEALERIRDNNRKLVLGFHEHAQSEADFMVLVSALRFLRGVKADPQGVKNFVVLFIDYNARIIVNPKDLEEYRKLPNAVVNPDLSRVKGVPPHLWRLTKSKNIVPISGREAQERESLIRKHGIQKFTPPYFGPKKSLFQKLLGVFRTQR